MKKNKFICLDKQGFPVEGFIGKPIVSFIRKLLLTRRIVKGELVIGYDMGSRDGDYTCYSIIRPNGGRLVVAFDNK